MKTRPALLTSDDLRFIAISLHEGIRPSCIAYYVYDITYRALVSRLKTCGTSVQELLNNPIPEREY